MLYLNGVGVDFIDGHVCSPAFPRYKSEPSVYTYLSD